MACLISSAEGLERAPAELLEILSLALDLISKEQKIGSGRETHQFLD
jgi:hypothetical protein